MRALTSNAFRLFRATAAGGAAGAAIAAIGFGFWRLTGTALSILPILAAVGVGFAVREASSRRQTRPYRFLAALITYVAASTTWIPEVRSHIEAAAARQDAILSEGTSEDPARSEPAPRAAAESAPSVTEGDEGETEKNAVPLGGKIWGAYILLGMALAWPWRGDGFLDALLMIFAIIITWSLNSPRPRPKEARRGPEPPSAGTTE